MKRIFYNLLLCLGGGGLATYSTVSAQVINTTTSFANNNGSGTVTFNLQNTNAYPIIITDIEGIVGTAGVTTAQIWYKPTPVAGAPGAISTANGWTLAASGTFTGIANTTTTVTQPFLTGLSFTVPGNTTWGMAITAFSGTASRQRYSTITGTPVISAGGVNLRTGTNIGYGGGVPPAAPGNSPRGWIGKITFIPAVPNNAGIGMITDPPTNICAGNFNVNAQVRNNGSNAINTVTINWSIDGTLQPPIAYTTPIPVGGNAIVSLGSVNFPAAVNKTIQAWTSQPNGVTDANMADDTATATRQALAAAVATITPKSSTRFCPGENVLLEANTGTGLSYQWKLNGANISGATNSSYTVTAGGNYTVEVKNSVCAALSAPLTIVVGPPVVNLGNDTAFCEPKNGFVLDAREPNAKYLWSTGDSSQAILVNDIGGPYWVSVSLGPNCITRDTIDLDISPLPRVTGMSYIKENAYTYHFEAAGAKYVDDYLWIFSDNTTDTGQKVTHIFPIGQHHSARLVISNGCSKDSVELQLPLSVENNGDLQTAMNIYPNPTSGQLTIEVSNGNVVDVSILNTIGSIVYNRKFDSKNKKEAINIEGLSTGSYLLLVNDGRHVLRKPLVVIR